MMAGRWTASDYLLRNEFCPVEQIQDDLDRVRVKANARWLLLIAYDIEVLRNLMFVSTKSLKIVRRFDTILSQSDVRMPELGAIRNVSEGDLIASLYERGFIDDSRKVHARQLPLERVSAQSISYWLVSSSRRAAVAALSISSPPFADMLNGTAIANVRRDQRIAYTIESVRQRGPKAARRSRISTADIAGLTRLAKNVVSADEVAFYTVQRNDRVLRRTPRELRGESVFPDVVPVIAEDGAESSIYEEYVRRAYNRSATRIYPPPIHRRGDNDNTEALVCLIVPHAPADRNVPALGVLAVHRRSDGGQTFTMFELALLRNVALRLALLSSMLRQDELARQVVEFGQRISTNSDDVWRDNGAAGSETGIPSDIALAKPVLAQLVTQMARATQSAAVTMRVLTLGGPACDNDFVLRRLFTTDSHPDPKTENIAVIGTNESGKDYSAVSVNAHAAVSGRAVHIWDSTRSLGMQAPGLDALVQSQYRERVRSELCFPVRCDACLVHLRVVSWLRRNHKYGLESAVRRHASLN